MDNEGRAVSAWAGLFFTVWWIYTIVALFKRKFALAFNFIFQMVVVGQFVSGDIPVTAGSVIGAFAGCGLVFILSAIPRGIGIARRGDLKQDDPQKITPSLFTPTVFEEIYLKKEGVDHQPQAIEVVDLLVHAGIGVGKYEGYPLSPIFWRKAAMLISFARGYNKTLQLPRQSVCTPLDKSWI